MNKKDVLDIFLVMEVPFLREQELQVSVPTNVNTHV